MTTETQAPEGAQALLVQALEDIIEPFAYIERNLPEGSPLYYRPKAEPQPKGMPAEWLDAFEEWRQTLGAADLDGKRDLVWRHIAGTGFQAGAAWARSQAPAPALAIPPGFALVPIEPTPAMKRACKEADMDHGSWGDWINFEWGDFRRAWDAMLAAAPVIASPAAVDGAAPILRKLVEQIDKAVFVDENGHPLNMNAAYLAAKEIL